VGLKKNVLAGYFSQISIALVGLIITPWYLARLGVEGYGLVGFFGVMLAWFQLLDIGLSPVVMREVARYRAGASNATDLWAKIRAIEGLFLAVAASGTIALGIGADFVAKHWLSVQTLNQAETKHALQLMAIGVGLRFMTVFYRSVLSGLERWVWLSGFNLTIALSRAIAVLPAMAIWGNTPEVFFCTQLAVGGLEVICLVWNAYANLPPGAPLGWSARPLRDIWRFSAAVAFTGGISVIITQSDRLILSGLIDLSAYAHFSLAALAASAILLVGAPLGSALQPRLTVLAASINPKSAFDLFCRAARLLCWLTLPLTSILAVHAESILWAWTGNLSAAAAGAPTLSLYSIGNAIAAQLVLPFSLQFAFGQMRRHVIGNVLLLLILVPSQILLTREFGATGAGICWLSVNFLYATLWIPLALRELAPQVLRDWYLTFTTLFALSVLLSWLARPAISLAVEASRTSTLAALTALGLLITFALACANTGLRQEVLILWQKHRLQKTNK
jgi:O-antigen/teichoic acid export membrane protein